MWLSRLNELPPNNLLNITFNYIFTVFAVCSSYKITTYVLLQMIVLFVQPNGLSSPGAGYAKFLLQIFILIQYVPSRLYRFLPLLAGQSSSGFIFDVGGKEGILAVELIPSDGGDAWGGAFSGAFLEIWSFSHISEQLVFQKFIEVLPSFYLCMCCYAPHLSPTTL